jgi:hypothetical protein
MSLHQTLVKEIENLISHLSAVEQKVYDLSKKIEDKDYQFEEMLTQADADVVTKNDRQRRCFVDGKKREDKQYQELLSDLEKTKIELNFKSRMYQLKLKMFSNLSHLLS